VLSLSSWLFLKQRCLPSSAAAAAQLQPNRLLPKVRSRDPRPASPERFVVTLLPHHPQLSESVVQPRFIFAHMGDPDLNARKEAVMASVRNELALANAQELMNVRSFASFFPLVFQSKKKCAHMIAACPLFSIHHSENERQVLRKVRDQTIYLAIRLRRGATNSTLSFYSHAVKKILLD
jgi:hypothetical protein